MYQFFIEQWQAIGEYVTIVGSDVNHIANVLRMKPGEHILVSDGQEREYECELVSFEKEKVLAKIVDVFGKSSELPVKVTLFQGLPKGDKMEYIIQKTVELGVSRIVPVKMKRSIVKFDAKKEAKKKERWNAIALSAAKQSKRGIIPKVGDVMTYQEAMNEAKSLGMILLPYENAEGMQGLRNTFEEIKERKISSVGIFIGPEGGFEESEIEFAKENNARIITLGKRILRTETAPIAALSMLTYVIED